MHCLMILGSFSLNRISLRKRLWVMALPGASVLPGVLVATTEHTWANGRQKRFICLWHIKLIKAPDQMVRSKSQFWTPASIRHIQHLADTYCPAGISLTTIMT